MVNRPFSLGHKIHLDMAELRHMSRPVNNSAVKDLVRGVEFESELKYVRIPTFKIRMHPYRGNSHNDQEEGLMRKGNMENIFNTLLEKGVKDIINVNVDDDEEAPIAIK